MKDSEGLTPLLAAIENEFPETAALLAMYGADVDATDRDGNSAHTLCIVDKGFWEIAYRLRERGAKVDQFQTYMHHPQKGTSLTSHKPSDWADG